MRPGIKRLVAGLILFLGAFIVPVLFVLPVIMAKSDEVQFKAPGKTEFTAKDAGRFYLWNDFQTVYAGKTYNQSEKLPGGLDIHIKDANGHELTLLTDTSISENNGTDSKKSIGYVETTQPGKLTIEITGGTEERIFSFGKSNILKIFGLIFASLGTVVFFGSIGFGLIIWGTIRLLQGRKG